MVRKAFNFFVPEQKLWEAKNRCQNPEKKRHLHKVKWNTRVNIFFIPLEWSLQQNTGFSVREGILVAFPFWKMTGIFWKKMKKYIGLPKVRKFHDYLLSEALDVICWLKSFLITDLHEKLPTDCIYQRGVWKILAPSLYCFLKEVLYHIINYRIRSWNSSTDVYSSHSHVLTL